MAAYRTYTEVIKPLIDLVVSILLFVILLPVFFAIAILLSFAVGNPFFSQERIGKDASKFRIIKFKTMADTRDEHGTLLPDEHRLTSLGKLIRKTSLDEIPQLINVIRGEMSFIGPRPLLVEYVPHYSKEQFRRHDVKPGISGWAQVNGRNAITWAEKFRYDVWYVDHQTFWLDLKILLITIVKVFKAEGISGVGVATAEKFNGHN